MKGESPRSALDGEIGVVKFSERDNGHVAKIDWERTLRESADSWLTKVGRDLAEYDRTLWPYATPEPSTESVAKDEIGAVAAAKPTRVATPKID